MLNFEEKKSRFRDKKINVLTLMLSENETKNHNPLPLPPLHVINGRSLTYNLC